MKVVYVGGHGRSGSTLLDVLLDASPQLLGVGELHHLPRLLADDQSCSCGTALGRCPFWARARSVVDGQGGAAAVAELTERVEASPSPPPEDLSAYRRFWIELIDSLAPDQGDAIMVDSSKSMGYSRYRFAHLSQAVDTFHLHLTRDPRAVTWSARKGPSAQFGQPRSALVSVVRSLYAWQASNRQALADAAVSTTHRLAYEDLVGDPSSTLEELAGVLTSWAGRSIDIPLLDRYQTGHGVGGNRMRFTSAEGVSIKPDTAWFTDMPKLLAAASLLASQPTAARLGYRW